MWLIMFFFFNNLTNYLYFYDKKMCLILNASMRVHELHTSWSDTLIIPIVKVLFFIYSSI